MFERYTEHARRALFFSREEVIRQGASLIETEHLLLALIREQGHIVADLLSAAHLAPEVLRKDIERESRSRSSVPLSAEIPFSAGSKRVLQFAAEEADRLGHPDIGPEHLLLGLLREADSPAASVLTRHGLELEAVRSEVVRLRALPRAASVGVLAGREYTVGFGVEPADEAVLHANREQLQAAENAFDADRIVLMMADDMVLMVPNEPVQEGKPACAAFVRRTLAEQQKWFDRVISYVSEEVAIRGDIAFDRGSFSFTVVVKHDRRRSEATGKYFWLYSRDRGGEWKLARAILSLDDEPEGGNLV
jgi:ketosteroid isomerase-like protein